jgi:radical SAM superfamily enzyme YgiQ (UPF0313 family)
MHAAYAGLSPCERATLPDDPTGPIRSVETGRPLDAFDCIFASVAWELEVPQLVRSLCATGLEPVRHRRPATQPLVVAGGPLTLSNPDLLAPFCDAVFQGEADGIFPAIASAIRQATSRDDALDRLASVPSMHVPAAGGAIPDPARAPVDRLPVATVLPGERNDFGDAFLVETGRGCPRACAFCVVQACRRRPAFVPIDRILAAIPEGTRRIGLVGAAVSDHPGLPTILEALRGRGISITLSSLRADRIRPEILRPLVDGGLHTLTIGVDGLSDAVRTAIRKGLDAADVIRAAELARELGVRRLKLYVMVGLPGETDADADEFATLARSLGGRLPVSVSVSPFVPKRFTPLEAAPFAGVRLLRSRLERLRHRLAGSVRTRFTSPREAELEWILSNARGEDARDRILALSRPT